MSQSVTLATQMRHILLFSISSKVPVKSGKTRNGSVWSGYPQCDWVARGLQSGTPPKIFGPVNLL